MSEEWRAVRGYEGWYEVSNFGSVRRVRGGRGARPKLMRQSNTDGYRYVQLCRRDVKRKLPVHGLVAEAFHGRKPRNKFPNHKNLNRSDNRADNLEWLTRKQNAQHALANGNKGGRPLHGMENGRAKLSLIQVREIIAQRGVVGQRALARLCGVSKSAIQYIHQGKHWKEEWPIDLRVREFPDV